MDTNYFDMVDVAILGGGAAGLSAARVTAQAGLTTALIERDASLGGILNQCIHNGFGLHYFGAELTGPEYAGRVAERALDAGCLAFPGTTVTDLSVVPASGVHPPLKKIRCCSAEHGVMEILARAVVLAMGSRERNRGNLAIGGNRPAGVFTAGTAQRLMNIHGYLPGREAVIIGSGDIGLIMARRLTWCGVQVKGVVEIMPYPAGLPRNLAQCLEDFNIPLHLNCQTLRINGRDRVESVDVAPRENGTPNLDKQFRIPCDTVLMAVGLVPENELSTKAGVKLDPATGGPAVDARLMTNLDGVFACGNVLHIHDLVDYVSEEAEAVAGHVIEYLGGVGKAAELKTVPRQNLRYVIPGGADPQADNAFFMRPTIVTDNARLTVCQGDRVIYSRPLKYVRPAEMLKIQLPQAALKDADRTAALEFSLLAG